MWACKLYIYLCYSFLVLQDHNNIRVLIIFIFYKYVTFLKEIRILILRYLKALWETVWHLSVNPAVNLTPGFISVACNWVIIFFLLFLLFKILSLGKVTLSLSLSLSLYIYIYIYIYNRLIGLEGRVFANGSVPGRVIPKTLKMVLDTSLLNTQQ